MSDPLANAYNLLGAQGMVGPNPYLEFTGQIPLAGYAGTPTNAQGQPIQSYVDANNAAQARYQQQLAAYNAQPPGTTLNSNAAMGNPMTQAASPSGLNSMGLNPNAYGLGMGTSPSAMNPSGNPALFAADWGGFMPSSGPYGGAGAQQAAPAPAPPSPPDMRQAYLQAMANPGPLPTYGAQPQPGAKPTGAPQPSVLAQFLAAHPSGGTTGAGGYTNAPFFGTLRNLQQAGATS